MGQTPKVTHMSEKFLLTRSHVYFNNLTRLIAYFNLGRNVSQKDANILLNYPAVQVITLYLTDNTSQRKLIFFLPD